METSTDVPTAPVRAKKDPLVRVKPNIPMGPGGRDWLLIVLLALLNLGSAYTTLLGARQVLPQPMSDVLAFTVQAMLFLALSGFVAAHAPFRRMLVVAVFASASVYTSFFTYYDQLSGVQRAATTLDAAHQTHTQFLSALVQPQQTEVIRLKRAAEKGFDQAKREADGGLTTGRAGFGPVARKLAEEARLTEERAATLQADIDRLAPFFEEPIEAVNSQGIYQLDLATWQHAPDSWKAEVPVPERGTYRDLDQEVALLTPFLKVQKQEGSALAALLLALGVDGISILLGTAIYRRRRPWLDSFSETAVTTLVRTKGHAAAIRNAWDRPALALDATADAEADAAWGAVVLRVDGRGSDFLITLYEALDPESGMLDTARLLTHPDASQRLAARMLLDRLRGPKLGWVEVTRGHWRVPEAHYPAFTRWLGEQLAQAHEEEAWNEAVEGPSTLHLVLPAAA